MNILRLFLFTLLIGCGLSSVVFAQDAKGSMGDFDMKVEDSSFPTPPNADYATAVVNYQLDYMGLKAGKNLLHTDQASGIKLFANYNPYTHKYNLVAQTRKGEDVAVKVEKSKEDPTCIFATVPPDWVNVLCSTRYTYSEDIKSKNSNKK
ncbi:MAG: hypothetical protein R3E32_25375 [Chitinophagales bacterium]